MASWQDSYNTPNSFSPELRHRVYWDVTITLRKAPNRLGRGTLSPGSRRLWCFDLLPAPPPAPHLIYVLARRYLASTEQLAAKPTPVVSHRPQGNRGPGTGSQADPADVPVCLNIEICATFRRNRWTGKLNRNDTCCASEPNLGILASPGYVMPICETVQSMNWAIRLPRS